MKSAYELAMERLEKDRPSAPITDAQKAEIAEIDSSFTAKIAEREVFLLGEITKARSKGDALETQELEQQLAGDLRRLRQQCEEKKEKVRTRAGAGEDAETRGQGDAES